MKKKVGEKAVSVLPGALYKEVPARDRDLLALGALPESRWFLGCI
ncbi:hypothetical protein [Chitinophaga sp. MM2321]